MNRQFNHFLFMRQSCSVRHAQLHDFSCVAASRRTSTASMRAVNFRSHWMRCVTVRLFAESCRMLWCISAKKTKHRANVVRHRNTTQLFQCERTLNLLNHREINSDLLYFLIMMWQAQLPKSISLWKVKKPNGAADFLTFFTFWCGCRQLRL